ncbi:hypothetical protein EGH21_17490 [Halomicroarcula sp. F13]|uniref:Uncharacterized protein n=1 Tax=Haloarcula rubra TaxID=2487747 RepID=A0AAW4PWU0_9EURY|nr:hypothetical protein [Halomicroarcula rubra]MBX0324823.1 hypothetical protein [Halomicroarcula rubra]
MIDPISHARVGRWDTTTNRYLKYAGGLFVLALLSIPASLAVAGGLKSTQPEVADAIAIGGGGGLMTLSLGMAILAAYRHGGYLSSVALSLAVPLAVAILYIVAGAMDQLVADIQLWIVIAFLIGGAVLLGTLTFAIGTSFRAIGSGESLDGVGIDRQN